MSPSSDSIDPRLHLLLAGELSPEDAAKLDREAAEDPELQRQLEAFRPLAPGQLDAVAQMGEANRPSRRKAGGRGRLSQWAAIVGGLASASIAVALFLKPSGPQYALRGELPNARVSFEAPVQLSLVSEASASNAGHIEVWARADDQTRRSKVELPLQRLPGGSFEVRAPAHRLTGGRFGPVEVSFVLSRAPRAEDAPFPEQENSNLAIVRTHLTVGAPPYTLALRVPTERVRMRSDPDPTKPVVQLRPEVSVAAGLAAHLYVVDGNRTERLEAEVRPVGTKGVLHLTPAYLPKPPARLVVAVGPKNQMLSPDQVRAAQDRTAVAPQGWWLSVVPIDRPSPTAPESQR